MTFNVLTDRWIPVDRDGQSELVSWRELLTDPNIDSNELRHVREDFECFALGLASALTQALVEAPDLKTLKTRLAEPMSLAELDAKIAAVRADFELEGVFMQKAIELDPKSAPEEVTDQLLVDLSETSAPWLTRPRVVATKLCGPCALLALWGLQNYAGAGGRGYKANIRGAGAITTMVQAKTVRESVWANTLTTAGTYGTSTKREEHPWRQLGDASDTPALLVGRAEGLFWRPRKLTLKSLPCDGFCELCGRAITERWTAWGLKANQGTSTKSGYYVHPHAPYVEGEGSQRGSDSRPTWTSAADLLPFTNKSKHHPKHAAPVAQQWVAQEGLGNDKVSLRVFWFGFNKATLMNRFCETWSLTRSNVHRDVRGELSNAVEIAEGVLKLTREMLHKSQENALERDKGKVPHTRAVLSEPDVAVRFWAETETPFWNLLHNLENEDTDISVDTKRGVFHTVLRSTALRLFDDHTASSCFNGQRQASVVRAQKMLIERLSKLLSPVRNKEKTPNET